MENNESRTPIANAERAHRIIANAHGRTTAQIAELLGVHINTVRKTLKGAGWEQTDRYEWFKIVETEKVKTTPYTHQLEEVVRELVLARSVPLDDSNHEVRGYTVQIDAKTMDLARALARRSAT